MKLNLKFAEFVKVFAAEPREIQKRIMRRFEFQYKKQHVDEFCKECGRKLKNG